MTIKDFLFALFGYAGMVLIVLSIITAITYLILEDAEFIHALAKSLYVVRTNRWFIENKDRYIIVDMQDYSLSCTKDISMKERAEILKKAIKKEDDYEEMKKKFRKV